MDEDEDVDIDGISNDNPLPPDLNTDLDFLVDDGDMSHPPEHLGNIRPEAVLHSCQLNDVASEFDNGSEGDSRLLASQQDYYNDAMVPSVDLDQQEPPYMAAVPNLVSVPQFGLLPAPSPGVSVGADRSDVSSLMIPTSLVGSNPGAPAATTAFAQVTKIEQGMDGKGYVLHLNIPALGLANVVLSTPGLSLAPGTDQKLLAAGANTVLPALLNMTSPGVINPMALGPSILETGLGESKLNPELTSDMAVDGYTIDDCLSFQEVDSGQESSPHSCESSAQDACTGSDLPIEDDDGQLDDMEQLAMMEGCSSSSDSGCGQGSTVDMLDNACDGVSLSQANADPAVVVNQATDGDLNAAVNVARWVEGQDIPVQDWQDVAAQEASSSTEFVDVAQWVEKPEVERFVICSDGPMECVLCSFKTVDYSTFKSHIICSHPCWRITKKLSKNRLLVEKSVKMNVNLTPGSHPASNARRSSSPKDKEAPSSDASGNGDAVKAKKVHVYQRKKKMLERNKRLFRCSLCVRMFVFEGSIVNHLVDHHMVKKPYDHIQVSNNHGASFSRIHRCSYKNCYTSCLTEEELERHRFESHAQIVYRCQICGFTADSAETVELHASSIHNQNDLMFGLVD